jgi:hypothetical protein
MAVTTFMKRSKEKNRQDKQRDKASKRIERKNARDNRPVVKSDIDPDIAGIIPGPQPIEE